MNWLIEISILLNKNSFYYWNYIKKCLSKGKIFTFCEVNIQLRLKINKNNFTKKEMNTKVFLSFAYWKRQKLSYSRINYINLVNCCVILFRNGHSKWIWCSFRRVFHAFLEVLMHLNQMFIQFTTETHLFSYFFVGFDIFCLNKVNDNSNFETKMFELLNKHWNSLQLNSFYFPFCFL